MNRESDGPAGDDTTFASALDRLKREGCAILIVGASANEAHEAVCRRLLGDDLADDRHRLFVTDTSATYRGHGGACIDHDPAARIIDYDGTVTPESPSPSGSSAPGPTGSDRSTSLRSLGIDVVETIEGVRTESDGLEAGELRVCVDSVVSLLTEHDTESVFKLLHIVTTSITRVDGMGHFHLPVSSDHDAVNLLTPLFDAVIEVRVRDGRIQQRWELRDYDVESDWLEL